MGLKPRQRPATYSIEATTEFLNVDLELESPSDLAALTKALGKVFVLHSSSKAPFVANLEIERVVADLDATILTFLELIEGLNAEARGHWDRCTRRCFDIGVQAGLEPHCTQYSLSASQVKRLATIDAEIVFTVYGAQYEHTAPDAANPRAE